MFISWDECNQTAFTRADFILRRAYLIEVVIVIVFDELLFDKYFDHAPLMSEASDELVHT